MKELKLKMDNCLPLRDVVYQTLREAILKEDLKPGERLMEVELANQLGVSRTPVREALRMLQLDGLVIMEPRKGAHVASITSKEMQDVLEVRTSLEVLAAQLACERMKEEELAELRFALEKFENALAGKDPVVIAEADMDFHDVIVKSTNNEKLLQILNNLRQQMYRYRLEYLKDFSNHARLLEEHRMLVDAIERRDKEEAGEISAEHIYNQEVSILRSIAEKE